MMLELVFVCTEGTEASLQFFELTPSQIRLPKYKDGRFPWK